MVQLGLTVPSLPGLNKENDPDQNEDLDLEPGEKQVLEIIAMQPGLNQRNYAKILSKRHRLMTENTAQKRMRALKKKRAVVQVKAKHGAARLYPAENVEVDTERIAHVLPSQAMGICAIVDHLAEDYADKSVDDKVFLTVNRLTMCFQCLNAIDLVAALEKRQEEESFPQERQRLRQSIRHILTTMRKDKDSKQISPRIVYDHLTNQLRNIDYKAMQGLKYYPPDDRWGQLAEKHYKKLHKL